MDEPAQVKTKHLKMLWGCMNVKVVKTNHLQSCMASRDDLGGVCTHGPPLILAQYAISNQIFASCLLKMKTLYVR